MLVRLNTLTLQLVCGHTVEHHGDGTWLPAAADCPRHDTQLIAHIDAVTCQIARAPDPGAATAWHLGQLRATTWRQRLGRLRYRRTAYTITITGPERLDGEKPYDYVLTARHPAHTIAAAARTHLFNQEEPITALTEPGPDKLPMIHITAIQPGTPAYGPDTPGLFWNDLRTRRTCRWAKTLRSRSS
ncbi:hypothetical protein GCM10028775_46560 [Catellatospora paridis]